MSLLEGRRRITRSSTAEEPENAPYSIWSCEPSRKPSTSLLTTKHYTRLATLSSTLTPKQPSLDYRIPAQHQAKASQSRRRKAWKPYAGEGWRYSSGGLKLTPTLMGSWRMGTRWRTRRQNGYGDLLRIRTRSSGRRRRGGLRSSIN